MSHGAASAARKSARLSFVAHTTKHPPTMVTVRGDLPDWSASCSLMDFLNSFSTLLPRICQSVCVVFVQYIRPEGCPKGSDFFYRLDTSIKFNPHVLCMFSAPQGHL